MLCRSRKGAWIEIVANKLAAESYNVAPARERGLKCHGTYDREGSASRSRKGAWIEIKIRFLCCGEYGVAPARERGLKYLRSKRHEKK